MARVRVTHDMALDAGMPEMEGAEIDWGKDDCDRHCMLCIHSATCVDAANEDEQEAEHHDTTSTKI